MIPPPHETPCPAITQEALDRLETNLNQRMTDFSRAERDVLDIKVQEIQRRLNDLNNSHEKATTEKKRTDEAALKVQENSVTRHDLQVWKDEVNKRLDLAAGASKTWALIAGLTGSVIVGLILQFASKQ